MWYEIVFRVLSILNYAVIIVIALPIVLQVLYILLAFVPKKVFPKSERKGRIAYLIPAHDEEEVIGATVRRLLSEQDYPRELFDVIVVAHNCTDGTARIAREAGAIVLELNDPDPAHRKALYPLRHGIEHILAEGKYDFVVHLDADNGINPAFSSLMNDAYQAGVDLARPYEAALNATANFYTKASAMLYSFDSRYGSRVRERLHLAAHVNGSGAMMSVRMLEKCGYDCETVCDDAEFNLNRLYDGYKGHFVEDAVVYEDMPASFHDTLVRNRRMGSSVLDLFKKNAFPMLGAFFRTGNFSFVEIFLLYMLNMLNVLIAVWMPLYYVYHFVFCAFAAYGGLEVTLYPAGYYASMIRGTLIVAACILVGLFLLFGYGQAIGLVLTDYKKLGAKNRRELLPTAFLFPLFLILYAVTLLAGTMSKPKTWEKLNRTKQE